MSISLKDALLFIWDRVDKQIQPITDNILAYRMIEALITKYPLLVKTINKDYLHRPAKFYMNTARQFRSTNWFRPDADSDMFEWNLNDFVYKNKCRDKLNGTNLILSKFNDVFKNILTETEEFLDIAEKNIDSIYEKGFFDQDIPENIIGTNYEY